MTERVVDNPANHGWTDAGGGKWTWNAGGGTGGGAIEDGTVQGQVTTWDAAKGEWTPESNVTVDVDVINVERATVGNASNDVGTAVGAGLFNNIAGSGILVANNGNLVFPSHDDRINLGNSNNRFKGAVFSGTVDAAGFTINGAPISGGGGGGLPDGGYTYGWTITATDFIATSDERVKDNITTAPVGFIDSLKGREWDWSGSGEKGSGVVAQELEQVLPHLVHEDDEGMKSVSYNGLVAYLIEEVKALKAAVEALKNG